MLKWLPRLCTKAVGPGASGVSLAGLAFSGVAGFSALAVFSRLWNIFTLWSIPVFWVCSGAAVFSGVAVYIFPPARQYCPARQVFGREWIAPSRLVPSKRQRAGTCKLASLHVSPSQANFFRGKLLSRGWVGALALSAFCPAPFPLRISAGGLD